MMRTAAAGTASSSPRTHYVKGETATTLCGKPVTNVYDAPVGGHAPKADCYSCLVAAGERHRGSRK